jgi:hypothetical protein
LPTRRICLIWKADLIVSSNLSLQGRCLPLKLKDALSLPNILLCEPSPCRCKLYGEKLILPLRRNPLLLERRIPLDRLLNAWADLTKLRQCLRPAFRRLTGASSKQCRTNLTQRREHQTLLISR